VEEEVEEEEEEEEDSFDVEDEVEVEVSVEVMDEEKEDEEGEEGESDDNAEGEEEGGEDERVDECTKEADTKLYDGVSHAKWKTVLGKPRNPNLMTIHGYRDKGYGIVRYTPKGGRPMEYDMFEKKDLETIRHLIRNPAKGTIWRVLRYETFYPKKTKKTQKSGRSRAPGFTTPSDDEGSAKVISAENDKTIKGHEKKAAAKTKVDQVKAVSHGVNNKPKTSKNVTTQKAVVKKSIQKPSATTTMKTAKGVSAKAKASRTLFTKNAGSKNADLKKSPPNLKKGKVVVMDRNDSDDDSLDLDNMEGAREAMAQIRKENRVKKPLVISVSAPFANVADGYNYYGVIWPKPGKVFFAKAPFFRGVITMANKKRKLLNPKEDGTWIETISSFNLRAKEFGEESIWLKTSSGNTIDVIYFVHAVPIGEEDTFLPTLKAKIKYFFDVTRKRKTNATGRLALDYCIDLPQGRKGGLGRYCLNKGTTKKGTAKEVVSDDKAADVMTEELDDHFKDGYTLQYDVPLNKFMVDWDIKQFLTAFIGANSWDDLAEEDKRKCFKDYPKKSLPDWDEIEQESY
jgi:hypothetical protein